MTLDIIPGQDRFKIKATVSVFDRIVEALGEYESDTEVTLTNGWLDSGENVLRMTVEVFDAVGTDITDYLITANGVVEL